VNDSPLVATGTYTPGIVTYHPRNASLPDSFRVKKLADGSIWCQTGLDLALGWTRLDQDHADVVALVAWDTPRREITARYTSHITLTGQLAEPEYESAMVEEALNLAVIGVNGGHVWVVLPIEGGDPVTRNSEDYPTPDGPDEVGDVLVARAEFFATNPSFEIIQTPTLCRCGAAKDSTIHTSGYVSGLPGHTYSPAS